MGVKDELGMDLMGPVDEGHRGTGIVDRLPTQSVINQCARGEDTQVVENGDRLKTTATAAPAAVWNALISQGTAQPSCHLRALSRDREGGGLRLMAHPARWREMPATGKSGTPKQLQATHLHDLTAARSTHAADADPGIPWVEQ